jgi:microcystin-dependent protein
MSKITLDSVASGYDLSKINTNFQTIQTAFDDTVSRSGVAPNTITADIDANGKRIYNLPDPVANGEPATKGWIVDQPGNAAADAALAEAAAIDAIAAAAVIEGFEWKSQWLTATAYAVNNLAYEVGNTYICLVAHTSGVFGTDFGTGKWQLFAAKGAAGAGTGDMVGSNNLSDLTDFTAARSTLGVQPTADPTFTGTVTVPTPAGASDTTVAATTEWVRDYIAAASSTPTGVVQDYVGSTEPSGWLFLSGLTIGNGSSAGTARANADTVTLFTLLWNSMADTEAPVVTGRGANAAADYAANKVITLPDARGRATAGKDNMGGTTASRITNAGAGIVGTTLGVAGGSQTHTLTTAQLASHAHGEQVWNSDTGAVVAAYGVSGVSGTQAPIASGSVYSGATALNTATAGSGDAHNNTQPTLILNKIIKL